MRYFRFTHAFGGHANDADSVSVLLRFADEPDLLELLCALGFEPIVHREKPPQPVPGTPYSFEDYAAFPALVPGTQWVQQPSLRLIDGVRSFVWCDLHRCRIEVIAEADHSYTVGEADIGGAIKLEPRIATPAERLIDPPYDTERCICPKYHPDVWAV